MSSLWNKFFLVKMAVNHWETCKTNDDHCDVKEGSLERVSPRIATVCQRDSLGVLQMLEFESISLDDIDHYNFENIPLLDDTVVRTPFFDQLIENNYEERDAKYNY